MVNKRVSSHFRTAKFLPRKPSPYSIIIYVILLSGFSIFIFIFYSNDVFEDGQKPPFSGESRSQQIPEEQLWEVPFSRGLHPCVKPSSKYKDAGGWDRYLTVRSNGGLNQMRTGISDMVAVARIMNATLVIPQLDKRSFWQDSSAFSDIFDEHHFISTLEGDVKVISELPKELESVPRARKHFTSWSGLSYYEEMTKLWSDYQKLVERLRSRGGRYIALHLRYEKDMLSFTGCTYGLTDAESDELRIMRESTSHWKMKKINSTEQRIEGFCPLTPKEVGIFLQALGYPPSTLIYIAAGEIYGGNTHLSELTSRFPNVVSKESLATKEELKTFIKHASQTAALDYIISIESDVFIPSYSGNMARAVEGHRRFLGHRKTITPDRKGLVEIFDKLEIGLLKEGSSLSYLVMQLHKKRQGAPRKRGGPLPGIKGRARLRTEESFYQNPHPECICNVHKAP
ncbi:O-fucosyltransferase 38 isoform X2 [Cornus florida]|uniref:O-fucosyltransferase 38 isoform X2 n=1 Tax=Cornus florida TaxID=4283 RepID=UPI00289FB192|nr:O-fucosyltransferase 38 isoform X2 [Cornus florida]